MGLFSKYKGRINPDPHGKTSGTSWHTLGFGLQTSDTPSRRFLIPAIVLEMTIPKLKIPQENESGTL